MSSERCGGPGRRRFPVGLTVAAGAGMALLIGLGAWQMHRLAWKEGLLAKIAALRAAPAVPLGSALGRPSRPGGLEFTRVETDCAPLPRPSPMVFRYALRDGQVAWRLVTVCRLAEGPYDGILLDRGLVAQLSGAMAPRALEFPEPGAVTGVLRSAPATSLLDPGLPTRDGGVLALRVVDQHALGAVARASGLSRPAPYLLAVEAERPAPAGVIPAALPGDIPNNHFVYALTWFGLAAVLAWIYGAMVWRGWRRP